MADIVEFLRARLAEDEAVAQAACHGEAGTSGESWAWFYDRGEYGDGLVDTEADLDAAREFVGDDRDSWEVSLRSREQYPYRSIPGEGPYFVLHGSGSEVPVESARHIARHDPARVLAEVESKRRIIAEHWRWNGPRGHWDPESMCACCVYMSMDEDDGGNSFRDVDYLDWPCPTLRILALPYQDHPDYDESWKP